MRLTVRPHEPERLAAGSWGDLEFRSPEAEQPPITARWLLLFDSLTELLDGLATLYANPNRKVFVFEGTGDPFTLRFEKRKAGRVEVRHKKTIVVMELGEVTAGVLAGCAPLVEAVHSGAASEDAAYAAETFADFMRAYSRLEEERATTRAGHSPHGRR